MTVIAGFQCSDALLMCADSEQSIGRESKSQARKIKAFKAGPISVAIGGAGDSDFIDYVQYKLGQRIAIDHPQWENAESWLDTFAKDMWNAFVRPYRGFAIDLVPEASFLIGLQMNGSYSLYRWERNSLYAVSGFEHASIGSGISQSESLLGELQFHLPAHQMLLYAVRVMLRVKELVQGCGGKTEAVLLLNDSLIMQPATIQIDAVEYLIKDIDSFLLDQSIGFIAGRMNADIESDLSGQAESLTRFRARYERIVPDLISWYQKGEIKF